MVGPSQDELFERAYTAKFEALLAPHGLTVHYDLDRAAIDTGFHPTTPSEQGLTSRLSTTRIWFQLKGIRATTLNEQAFASSKSVSVSVSKEQVRFWYASSEPVYAVVYLDAVDTFIGEDVRDIVDRQWGEEILRPDFLAGQDHVTLHIDTRSIFDEARISMLIQHRSMRVDGPAFRGRPLGHRLDPLRCELDLLQPELYRSLVHRLLEVHGFERIAQLDPAVFGLDEADQAELIVGRLFSTYEFIEPMFGEYGTSDATGFRIEAPLTFAQGPVAVLIHSSVQHPPTAPPARLKKDLESYGCARLLVFANTPDNDASYLAMRLTSPLPCMPQRLGSLAFSILTATNVFLEFRHLLRWKLKNYLYGGN